MMFIVQARVWTNELAFVVAFGTLFVKVWRLYKVFFNKKMVKRVRYSSSSKCVIFHYKFNI